MRCGLRHREFNDNGARATRGRGVSSPYWFDRTAASEIDRHAQGHDHEPGQVYWGFDEEVNDHEGREQR